MVLRKFRLILLMLTLLAFRQLVTTTPAFAENNLSEFDLQVQSWAMSCRDEVAAQLKQLVSSNRLSIGQLFDTFYIPIPNTDPQKYNTQYDKYTDEVVQPILDKYLKKDKRLFFVIAVDINGYVPTHNAIYSKSSNGEQDDNIMANRTKRLFNDRTGLAAARNTQPYLKQTYNRDNGDSVEDFSVPILIDGKHWGAIRMGYVNN